MQQLKILKQTLDGTILDAQSATKKLNLKMIFGATIAKVTMIFQFQEFYNHRIYVNIKVNFLIKNLIKLDIYTCRYRIQLNVDDAIENDIFILFDKEAKKLLQTTARELKKNVKLWDHTISKYDHSFTLTRIC